ncbi:MAG: hypothetical protein MSA26_16285 [Lachnospiraceae bacterium]|nr:hypothetical protein [Lachnospiraceae bacterium]
MFAKITSESQLPNRRYFCSIIRKRWLSGTRIRTEVRADGALPLSERI